MTRLSTAANNRQIDALLTELTATETVFPGTILRMVCEVAGPPNPCNRHHLKLPEVRKSETIAENFRIMCRLQKNLFSVVMKVLITNSSSYKLRDRLQSGPQTSSTTRPRVSHHCASRFFSAGLIWFYSVMPDVIQKSSPEVQHLITLSHPRPAQRRAPFLAFSTRSDYMAGLKLSCTVKHTRDANLFCHDCVVRRRRSFSQ